MRSSSSTGMTLKYEVMFLLNKVKANKEKHKKNYENAVIKYRKKLIRHFEEQLKKAKANKNPMLSVLLRKPVEYIKHYDTAISMLSQTMEAQVELDHTLYEQLVLDEWSWKSDFLSNTMVYNG